MESALIQKQINTFAGSKFVLLSLGGQPVRPAHSGDLMPALFQVSQHCFFLRFFFIRQSISPSI
jgi:hypothetical protein